MYEELVKRLREESEIERWLQPHSANETPKLLDDAADAIEELEKFYQIMADAYEIEVTKERWISVTEKLPEDKRDVQITVFWHDAWRTMYGYYDGEYWHLYAPMHTEVADVEVIGWMEKPSPMPLPEPPKEST